MYRDYHLSILMQNLLRKNHEQHLKEKEQSIEFLRQELEKDERMIKKRTKEMATAKMSSTQNLHTIGDLKAEVTKNSL